MIKRSMEETANGAATYIAPGTKIVGNFSGDGNYIFCGEVEGECDIKGPVTVAEGSLWKGSIKATDVILAGKVEGDVVARRRVEISGSARVTGSLRGGSIVVAEGAVIEGQVSIADAKEVSPAKIATPLNVSQAES